MHGVRRGELHTVPDSAFDPRFWDDIARREAREPLQHITGQAHFRYLELEVGPGVFVPRPETEVMTGWAIARLGEMDVAEPVVADLGTGSGAIALAIAQEVPRARVHAVEADPLARAWAERNITRYVESDPYTAGRVMLHAGDFSDALGELDGTVDLVISNPPYIPVGASVPPEVGEYDPAAALVERRGRAERHPRRRTHRAAAAPPGRAGRRRARRAAGRRRVLGVPRGIRLAGHTQQQGSGRA